MDPYEWQHARDRGHHRYDNDDEDIEALYIGVPASHRRKGRRRRSSNRQNDEADRAARHSHYEHHACQHARRGFYQDSDERDDADDCARILDRIDSSVSPVAERLRHILGEDDGGPTPTIFTEMDTLQQEGGELEWKESARWVKFEEKVEEGGERWSKPHVSTLTLHSLFELRTCLQTGNILLDLEAYSLAQIVEEMVARQMADGLFSEDVKEKIVFVLLRRHRHQTKKAIHRSLADIGKSSSSSAATANRSPQANLSCSTTSASALHRSTDDLRTRHSGSLGRLHHAQSRSMNDISETPSSDQLKNKFMKKIPRDAEASNVLIGEVDFLDKPFVSFVRLAQATTLGGLTEVPVPTRFLFILLGPHGKTRSYNEIGRAIATLMVDDLFSDVAYKARDREDLIAGVDEFLDEVIVLPPGEWDPKIRIEPPKKVPSADMRKSVLNLNELAQMNGSAGGVAGGEDEQIPVQHEVGEELKFTGRLGGGLWLDIKRKMPWYCSDIYDGFHIQTVSAVLFIYLGCITNAITFGGLLGDATDNYQGVIESFLGTALAGTVFCLFGGQPLIILSSTGPILIFEKLLYEFCKNNGVDYMELRLWIGIHSCLQCFILVLTDASYIIQYMTRFTEEGFSSLISFIFISDAIKKMVGAFKYYPINRTFKPDYMTSYKCDCVPPDQPFPWNVSAPLADDNMSLLFNVSDVDWSQLSKKECVKYGGALMGKACKYVPDLALMSFILFFGTYSTTVTLKKFKFSRYFPTKLRQLISDFSIIIAILLFCGLDLLLGLDTPKLHVPMQIKPTRADRGWLVMPFGKNPWWWYLASFVPALLVTILIFMDQQISAVIVNRKENKLKKACGYHLDLFWVGMLMAVCSFMGLPWYVAATVISIAHIDSLKMESESSAPGEQPQFLGVREQRLTGILVFVLTGLSVFLAPVLQYIPMPVLYGIFLYMGVASLSGIQFWERIKLYLMAPKHQPDFAFLRHVPLRRVHLFTLVQITCLAVLWVLKSTFLAIIFPVMILGLMVVRKLLDLMFSQHDLAWLDDILPDREKKKNEDDKKKKKKKKTVADTESDEEIPMELDSAHANCPTPASACEYRPPSINSQVENVFFCPFYAT
ncbi:electrogenic sodium bicarbonate cotransporter 4 isoform X3 [Phyllopteryx taeniolatus]|uniref:electrogenic sodium bicarbonate cotransporter 4 isoform X3 n=1 Tax=Phyllopteryx taeniolatus TaxID=161469 RepID=UPI002AD241EF|nr:electrogenic sodium bicarbonate cotransporter 4 isoform X3 [Phyllopteryx taeniolatus]